MDSGLMAERGTVMLSWKRPSVGANGVGRTKKNKKQRGAAGGERVRQDPLKKTKHIGYFLIQNWFNRGWRNGKAGREP